jgi:hypothetical protein
MSSSHWFPPSFSRLEHVLNAIAYQPTPKLRLADLPVQKTYVMSPSSLRSPRTAMSARLDFSPGEFAAGSCPLGHDRDIRNREHMSALGH